MENSKNRILNEISAWNQKVDNLKDVFGSHAADYRHLVRAKLEHFKEIKTKYKIPANQDEKIASKILAAEVRRLEKLAFPNRIERLVRRSIENVRFVIQKILTSTRSQQQDLTKDEFSKKEKPMDLGSYEKNLNKTAIQYDKKLKSVKSDTLLPKLRNGNTKGLKM